MRMPPNPGAAERDAGAVVASMRGGMRMPPNCGAGSPCPRSSRRFNEGRHAHAAESTRVATSARRSSSFNEGRHAHAAEYRAPLRPLRPRLASMRGGMRMPPNDPDSIAAGIRDGLLQ